MSALARAAELHQIAAHAHIAASFAQRRGEPSAQELALRAHEYSRQAYEATLNLATNRTAFDRSMRSEPQLRAS